MGINEKKIWENILRFYYNPKTKNAILATYENDFSISKIGISAHNILQRFRELNRDADSYQDMIKPFNFATIGTGYRKNKEKQPIIPFLSNADGADRQTCHTNRLPITRQAQCMMEVENLTHNSTGSRFLN